MKKNVGKGMKLSMATEKGIVSTALLSLLFEKSKKDNLDLLRPFVECAICAKYSVGERIDIATIASHMEAEFGFESVADSVVESILERLCKEKFVSLDHHAFYYGKTLEERSEQFSSKKERAKQLLKDITNNLHKVFDVHGLLKLTDEEIHHILYEYFEKYGLSLFSRTPPIVSGNKNPYLFTLATYIIEQEKTNSPEFMNIVQLYKGVLLSSVVYMQPENSELYRARFKNTTVYLDAPIVLRMLGLCSDVENRRGKQLYDLLKGKVTLKMYQHSFNELCGILNAFRKNRNDPYRGRNTLIYFNKNKYSSVDISNYYTQLPQILTKLGIVIEDDVRKDIDRAAEGYVDLRAKLKKSITFYEDHESALEYDTASLFFIRLIRGEKVVTAIENCGSIFVTMNKSLAAVALEWQNDELNPVPLVISDVDLSVIMWLKEYRSKQEFPKDFIVANAFGTLEAISDSFMEQLSKKVVNMEQEGIISSTDVSLVLENIYIQRQLLESAKGDIQAIADEDIIAARDQYKAEYAREIGMDNAKLTEEVQEAEETIDRMSREKEKSYSAVLIMIDKQAKDYAKSATEWINVCKWLVIVISSIVAFVMVVVDLCLSGSFTMGALSVVGIILGIFTVCGILDTLVPAFKFIDKLRQTQMSKKYTDKYAELLKNYEEATK